MTLSVIAYEKQSRAIGVAAATGNLAVGAWVPRAIAKVGGVVTQGLSPSTLWGDKALTMLGQGHGPKDVVDRIAGDDPGREHRQLAVMDNKGQVAVWTGSENFGEKGHLVGEGAVFIGNWLSSIDVLTAMEKAYSSGGLDSQAGFGQRLLRTLEEGINAGSDSRGTLSAAMLIVRPDLPPMDLRVDYDEKPLERLAELYGRTIEENYAKWFQGLPTLENPHRS